MFFFINKMFKKVPFGFMKRSPECLKCRISEVCVWLEKNKLNRKK